MDRNKAEDLADKIFDMIDQNHLRGLIKSDLVDLIANWQPSDPPWLARILEQAAAEEWCVTIHGCCGARQMRRALGLARRRQMSPERAQELVAGLKSVTAEKQANPEPDANGSRSRCTTGLEPAVRYVLYAVWLSVGDDYFDQLSGTYAGAVLERMRGHTKDSGTFTSRGRQSPRARRPVSLRAAASAICPRRRPIASQTCCPSPVNRDGSARCRSGGRPSTK